MVLKWVIIAITGDHVQITHIFFSKNWMQSLQELKKVGDNGYLIAIV